MKILHTVEFYEPSKGGAQEVVRQLSERLARRGHDVTVATSLHRHRTFDRLNGVTIASFDIGGNQVKGIRGNGTAYQQFIAENKFDIVLNYAAQTWTTDLMYPILDRLEAKRVIAPLGYSRLSSPRYREYFRTLPEHLRKYDAIVYTSANYQDKMFGDAHGVNGRAVVIPNGASEEEFASAPGGFKEKYGIHTRYLFLNVSNHYFDKGHRLVLDAMRKFGEKDATLAIIGERPSRHGWHSCYPTCVFSAWRDRRIRVFQHVPRADVVRAYREADLFLFGSRVECAPLVMYEAFASRTPFITTDVGNVKDHAELISLIQSGDDLLHVLHQFRDQPDVFRSRADRAQELFRSTHTWERLVDRYEELYRRVVRSG